MEALELAIQIVTAISKAYPVVKGDIERMSADDDTSAKLKDAIKAARDALDALDSAILK